MTQMCECTCHDGSGLAHQNQAECDFYTMDFTPCSDLDRCPVSEREDICLCPDERTPATWSTTFGTDLSRVPDRTRIAAVGKTIRTARAAGIEVRHRSKGWTTIAGDEVLHWWPADVNRFADYVAQVARDLGSTKKDDSNA